MRQLRPVQHSDRMLSFQQELKTPEPLVLDLNIMWSIQVSCPPNISLSLSTLSTTAGGPPLILLKLPPAPLDHWYR